MLTLAAHILYKPGMRAGSQMPFKIKGTSLQNFQGLFYPLKKNDNMIWKPS